MSENNNTLELSGFLGENSIGIPKTFSYEK